MRWEVSNVMPVGVLQHPNPHVHGKTQTLALGAGGLIGTQLVPLIWQLRHTRTLSEMPSPTYSAPERSKASPVGLMQAAQPHQVRLGVEQALKGGLNRTILSLSSSVAHRRPCESNAMAKAFRALGTVNENAATLVAVMGGW